METDSNDSQKNAVFGIVVSNTRKGARGECRGVHHFHTQLLRLILSIHYCIALLVQHDPRSSHF